MFHVIWTGEGYFLELGEWVLYRDNWEDISYMIPEEKRHTPMNTYKRYNRWTWANGLEWYTDGLEFRDWFVENLWWVYPICSTMEEAEELYRGFQAEDWRPGSHTEIPR